MNRSAFAAVAVACTTAVRIVGCGGSSGELHDEPDAGWHHDSADGHRSTSWIRRGIHDRVVGDHLDHVTPLLTYLHASGERGTELIPGLAALPQISSDGKTYRMQLRPGLVFSNGQRVNASDFAYTIERAMKLNWGGKSFFTGYVVGASAYDQGASKTTSGIRTDDATGRITIHLTKRSGAFGNVLAFPSAGAESLSSGPEGGSPVFAIGH